MKQQAYKIGIIVFDGVLTSEVVGPAEVFAIAGQHEWFQGSGVQLIGIDQSPTIRTEEGLRLMVDATISDELALDVLFVPGGNDMGHLLQNEALNRFIRNQEEQAQWLGSVCAGAFCWPRQVPLMASKQQPGSVARRVCNHNFPPLT